MEETMRYSQNKKTRKTVSCLSGFFYCSRCNPELKEILALALFTGSTTGILLSVIQPFFLKNLRMGIG
jgi:hypothetical protein